MYTYLVIVILLYIIISICIALSPQLFFDSSVQRMNGKRVRGNSLLVIAHPDDESMFFGPTVVSFLKQRKGKEKFYILCLSNGDYGGADGEQRQAELFAAAQAFGLSASDVTITLSSHLKDGNDWNELLITNIVQGFVSKHSIKNIVTFDGYGVSGHKNHVSIFNSIKNIPAVSLFALESVSIIRKYSSILDLPFTLILNCVLPSKTWIEIISFTERRVAINALYSHKSQMVWFRRLYSFFSRYMFLNTYNVYK